MTRFFLNTLVSSLNDNFAFSPPLYPEEDEGDDIEPTGAFVGGMWVSFNEEDSEQKTDEHTIPSSIQIPISRLDDFEEAFATSMDIRSSSPSSGDIDGEEYEGHLSEPELFVPPQMTPEQGLPDRRCTKSAEILK